MQIRKFLFSILFLLVVGTAVKADPITLVAGSSVTANYSLAGTNASAQAIFSFDGTTIRVEFRNTSTNDFRLGAISFSAQQYSPGQDNISFGSATLSNGQIWGAGGDDVFGFISIRYFPIQVSGGIGYLPRDLDKLLAPGGSGISMLSFIPKLGGTVPSPPFPSVTLSFTNAYFINPNGQPVPVGQILAQTASGTFSGGGAGAAVPEPATMILLGSGLAALGMRARRRKQ
jgi:PEP-CTERM motif